ncbi:MAG: phosphoglycerate dehydrogenase [Rhodopseudomonas sp.]|nr:phosphoglycerate dehydrogenase [Rhodopseudomonas sp.]
MNSPIVRVAVASRSFSRHPQLRKALSDRYPNVTFNDAGASLAGDQLIEFLRGHDRAITALEKLDDALFSAVPELRVIGKYGVGLDMIDLEAMRRHGVKLGWTGGVNRRAVSELVVAFAIALLRHVPEGDALVRGGGWQQLKGRQLSGRTVGIIGLGHVGKDLVQLLKPFGCRILANDILQFPNFCRLHGVTQVALDELLRESDIVTLHVPLDGSTRGLLTNARLDLMRRDAVLINAARGGLVDEVALREKLRDGHLAAAAFDVFADEPPSDRELLTLPNMLSTPHIGGSSEEAILAMGLAAIDGLDKAGDPIEVATGRFQPAASA